MATRPMPHFVLIKISKDAQKTRREKIGSLYLAEGYKWMTREVQSGEIVSIGKKAKEQFPELKQGQTLLIHHFVTGKASEQGGDDHGHLIDQDETYNYYVATTSSFNGRRNESYGVWDGEKIIAHPDIIFLEVPKKVRPKMRPEDYTTEETEKVGGLYLMKDWIVSRDQQEARLTELRTQVDHLSKGTMKGDIIEAIKNKEAEMEVISKAINKSEYKPFKVVSANKKLKDTMGYEINPGDTVYMFGAACETKMEFMGVEYIVASASQAGALRLE